MDLRGLSLGHLVGIWVGWIALLVLAVVLALRWIARAQGGTGLAIPLPAWVARLGLGGMAAIALLGLLAPVIALTLVWLWQRRPG